MYVNTQIESLYIQLYIIFDSNFPWKYHFPHVSCIYIQLYIFPGEILKIILLELGVALN